MKTSHKPSLSSNLSLIKESTNPLAPVAKFGKAGNSLWCKIMSSYAIDDMAGREMLAQACFMADRVEALATRINQDGEVVEGHNGILKEHPALRAEKSGRAFIIST